MPTGLTRTTQKELARLAGVTPAAVTAALSERPSSIRVSQETRQRIRQLARQYNYKPDIRARGLVQRKSFLIGILCTEGMSHVMWEVVHGIEEVADQFDYSVLLSAYPNSLKDEAVRLQRSLDRGVDALAAIPVIDEKNRTNLETFRAIQRRGTPVLQLFDRFLTGIPSITEDGHAAGMAATRCLLDLGHRRILHLTMADYEDRIQPGQRRNVKARYEGYRDAMIQAGLEPVVCDRISNVSAPPMYAEARQLARSIADYPVHPTAVFCYSDRIAFGLMNGLADLGVSVPGEISVVGYDNLSAGGWSRPTLTSVGINRVEMGRQAAAILLAAMEGSPAQDVRLPPQVTVRESVGRISDGQE